MMKVRFDSCFQRFKIQEFAHMLPDTYQAMEALAGRKIKDWPRRIEGMTWKEIREGAICCAKGHGLYFPEENRIKINPNMSALGIYFNFIHENLHHAIPAATDEEINDKFLPLVYHRVTGEKLPKQHDGVTPMKNQKGKGKAAFKEFVRDFAETEGEFDEGEALAAAIYDKFNLHGQDTVDFDIAWEAYLDMMEETGDEIITDREADEFWEDLFAPEFEELYPRYET